MSTQLTRTFTVTAAITGLLLGLPGRAAAQRVRVDVRVSAEIGREIRDAVLEATSGVGDAIREVSRELGRSLGHDLGRDITETLRALPDIGVTVREFAGAGAWDGGWERAQSRNWTGRAEDRETRSLAIGANGTLEVNNLSGDITVTAGGGTNASVQLIRRSRGRTDADARTGLERVQVDTRVVGSRATVRTNYPNERQPNYSVSVDMIISAPAGTRIVVNSVSADVKVSDIRGELSVTTISGDITLRNVGAVSDAKTASGDVTITGATGDGTLNAGTLSGDVTLEQVKARRIAANTVSGSVNARNVTCETATLGTMSGDAVFSGELARNGRYELTSHSGDVRFTPSGSVGFTVTASSFGGDISSSLALQGDITRSRRRSLNGKVGDGSATVTLQTFNGDITIGKER